MQIRLLHLLEGAKKAVGTAVVIDVFRAFSLEAYMTASGAERILAVGAESTARHLKEVHPEYVLAGERHGAKLPGFDLGNSPYMAQFADLFGKTIVHTTSAGTQGLAAAANASEILTGSLVNARAIASYLKKRDPKIVSICCMGWEGLRESPEDELCGRYISSLLKDEPFDMARELEILRYTSEGAKFFDPAKNHIFPQGDYGMCTDVDRFDFILKANRLEQDVFEVSKQDAGC